MYNPNKLKLVAKFMNSHKDKKIIETGDLLQLKCFGFVMNNVTDISKYVSDTIYYIFNNRIELFEWWCYFIKFNLKNFIWQEQKLYSIL